MSHDDESATSALLEDTVPTTNRTTGEVCFTTSKVLEAIEAYVKAEEEFVKTIEVIAEQHRREYNHLLLASSINDEIEHSDAAFDALLHTLDSGFTMKMNSVSRINFSWNKKPQTKDQNDLVERFRIKKLESTKEKINLMKSIWSKKDEWGKLTSAAKDFKKKYLVRVMRCVDNHFKGDVEQFAEKYPSYQHTKFKCKCCKGNKPAYKA